MAASGTGLRAGTLLGGRYRLERRIGGGGMASVWLATDGQLGRAVAVKVLSDTLADDPGYRARFRREAKVAAQVSHASLVRIFDTAAQDGRPYLVMEYVPGPTLAARIAAGERVDANRLADELLGALAHIHRAGIVHRDVKPANVLFDPGGRTKLTDFGIAQPEDATQITQTGEVIGTPASISASVDPHTEPIDEEPFDSSVSETSRIVYGKSASGGITASSARWASAPWPMSRRLGPVIRPVSPTENGGKL